MTATVYSRRGSETHAQLLEAFIKWGGYLLIDDVLYHVMSSEPAPRETWRWELSHATPEGYA